MALKPTRTPLTDVTRDHPRRAFRWRRSLASRIADRTAIEVRDNREPVANLVVRIIPAAFTACSIVQTEVTFPERSGPQVKVYRLGSPAPESGPGVNHMDQNYHRHRPRSEANHQTSELLYPIVGPGQCQSGRRPGKERDDQKGIKSQ